MSNSRKADRAVSGGGLKRAPEIKRILTQELGFTDLAAYTRWANEVRPTIRPTPERIALLSPDVVDCYEFWQVCEELFGHDPVANTVIPPEVGALPFAIETQMDANRMNLRLAKALGITAFLEEFAQSRLRTLEIGPGYGSLKSFIETHTQHEYLGVDVYPRIPGVTATTRDGLLPRQIVEENQGTLSYVVSSNVFQHLSSRQRSQYYADARALLREGGLFIFNILVDTGKLPAHSRDEEGNAWCDHYGQYTRIPKGGEIYADLRELNILYVTQRYDGVFNFVCQKRG